ncbi:MAG TPA: hypothetical protein VGQ42_03970 [Candidatus Dormibacteraeota bacterium]|jgi:hypothetical protein|nr:hypothetical protein [Candidatus Dormibacteraeota bacterium]
MLRRILLLVAAAGVCTGVSACGNAEAKTDGSAAPARLVTVSGGTGQAVQLTEDSMRRIALSTEPVVAAADNLVIPVTALVYDKDGGTWVFLATQPLTFERRAVTIARVSGDRAVLSSGPAAGSRVVTVGAAELLGTEYGVSGG